MQGISAISNTQPPYRHWFPPVRFYWNKVQQTVAGFVECPDGGLILDFGCGRERIVKKYLPRHTVVGYDSVSEYSEIKDYRDVRPHTILCSHVLEHLTQAQLEQTLSNFVAMDPRSVITAQPTENLLSRLSWLFSGEKLVTQDLRAIDHKLSIQQVHEILGRFFTLQERKNVLTLTVVSTWVPKPA